MRSHKEERRLHRRLQELTEPLRHLRLAEALVSLSLGLMIICQTYLLARLIEGLVFGNQSGSELTYYIWGFLAALLMRGLLLLGQERLAQEMALRVKTRLRQRLSEALLHLGPIDLGAEQTGELVNTTVEGAEKLDDYFTLYLPKKLHLSLLPPAILLAAALADPLSALVLLITGPIIPLLMWLIGTWAKERTRQQWRAMSVMSAHFLDVLQGLKTLQLFGRERAQITAIRDVSDDFRRTTMSVLTVAFLSSFFLELSASISTAIVAVQVGVRLIEGHLLFATGFFVLLLAPEYYLPFRQFGAAHHAGMEGVAAAERIFEILDRAPGLRVRSAMTGSAQKPTSSAKAKAKVKAPQISFQKISLIYPGRKKAALSKVDLHLLAGQTTAIVGPSGAGKSSLIRLLMGFQEPTAGAITVDGAPLSAMDLKDWRRQVAFIRQSPHFFKGSIHDNLLLSRPEATQEEIEAALKAAQAFDFIQALPQGVRSPLSEGGQNLSGGQRQRLSLARAYLKDAPLLVLDEPSSQLDPLTEEAFTRALFKLCQGKTALIIAHRLNTVLDADQIVVLDQGQVIACGAHDELYEQAPLYRQMVDRQMAVPLLEDAEPRRASGGAP